MKNNYNIEYASAGDINSDTGIAYNVLCAAGIVDNFYCSAGMNYNFVRRASLINFPSGSRDFPGFVLKINKQSPPNNQN